MSKNMAAAVEGTPDIIPGTRINFKYYRRKDVSSSRPLAENTALCAAECGAEEKCRVVAVHDKGKGATVCEFGTAADIAGNRTSDKRWMSAILPEKATAEERVGQVQTGQKYAFKAYKSTPYKSGKSMADVTSECMKECKDDDKCAIMAVHNPKTGASMCHRGDASAATSYKATTDGRWNSAVMGDKAGAAGAAAGGAPEMGFKYNFRSYRESKKDAKRKLEEVIKLCQAECTSDPKCAVVTAYNPKTGANKCYFGDKSAADPNKLTKQQDDRWAGVVIDRGDANAEPNAPGDAVRYNFAAYKDKTFDAGRPLAEVLELCKKECVDDRKCRIVAAENALVGPNKCYFGDVVAMQNNVEVADERWMGAIVDEKPPRPPGVGQKYGFSPFRDVSYDPGRPIGEVLELCKRECAVDRKCRIVGVESPESGPNKCYLGDEASFLKHTVTDDERWMSATLPPKGPMPDGYQVRYDFRPYKTELVDSTLPLVEVHEKCRSMCDSDDKCAVVATNDTLTGPYKCVFGNADSVGAMKKTDDVNWMSSLLPRKRFTDASMRPGAAKPPAGGAGSAAPKLGDPGYVPATEEEALIAKYMAAGMTLEEATRQAQIDLEAKTSLFGFDDGEPVENMPLPYARDVGTGVGMGIVLVIALFGCAAVVLLFWMFCAWLGLGTAARA